MQAELSGQEVVIVEVVKVDRADKEGLEEETVQIISWSTLRMGSTPLPPSD
jgi:hypothetical protein